jgi:hypothetical protein
MAEWKKVIVSGSNASLSRLVVDDDIQANRLSGSFSGSFKGDGSGLTGVSATALDIDNFGSDHTSITVAGTDKLPISDAGIEGRINVSQLATPLAGTGVEASSGTIRIATTAAGNGLTGGGGSALSIDADSESGGDIQPVNVTANGVGLDIQAIAGDGLAADGAANLAVNGGAGITVGSNVSVDSGSLLPYFSSSIFGTVSGDITITNAGVASIAANSVALGTDTTGSYVATVANVTNGGLTVNNSGTETAGVTVALNLNDLAAATVNVANDSIAIIDADASNGTRKESIADLVAGIAGTNLTAGSGQLSLASSISGNHTFSNNVTVSGNLTIEGSQINASVTNLDIEDRFILLNSGSADLLKSGIIFGGSNNTLQSGSALIWDTNYNSDDGRLAIVNAMGSSDLTATADYYIAGVYLGNAADAATAQADHSGNIRIDSGEIYIYVVED